VIYENVSKTIDNTFCIDADLKTPETIRNCGTPECPFWESGQWSDVSFVQMIAVFKLIALFKSFLFSAMNA
jgi:hypothetical protein